MTENIRVAPAYVLIGDPTTAAGADMKFIGKTRGEITIAPNINIAMGRTDQTGSTPLAGSVYFNGLAPVATVPLVDEEKAKLALYLPNSNVEEAGALKAIGFGSGFKHIAEADIPTIVFVPVKDSYPTELSEELDAVWLTAGICNEFGNVTFNLPDEGDDALNPHEVNFAGLYRAEDQGATAIPESMRVIFQGSPGAGGLSWFLPDVAEFI